MTPPVPKRSKSSPELHSQQAPNGRFIMIGWTHVAAVLGAILGLAGGTFGILAFTAGSWVDNRVDQNPRILQDRRAVRTMDDRLRKVEVRQEVAISKIDDLRTLVRNNAAANGGD